ILPIPPPATYPYCTETRRECLPPLRGPPIPARPPVNPLVLQRVLQLLWDALQRVQAHEPIPRLRIVVEARLKPPSLGQQPDSPQLPLTAVSELGQGQELHEGRVQALITHLPRVVPPMVAIGLAGPAPIEHTHSTTPPLGTDPLPV